MLPILPIPMLPMLPMRAMPVMLVILLMLIMFLMHRFPHPHTGLIIPRTLPIFSIPAKILPQPLSSELGPPLRSPILALHTRPAKLGANLRLVHCR